MADYMFMLESHLSSSQSQAVTQIQAAASEAGFSVFLSGGALRDMLAGLPIVEIDFTVEGNAIKLAKAMAAKVRAEILDVDENRKYALLRFPTGVRVSIGMARVEKFAKPGSKPQVQPASIHEDLRGRDFTMNSIALSLNPASRGLLLDPNNGVGDIAQHELRTVSSYTLYDDPVRLLRLQRYRVRLGFNIVERTVAQYANAREAQLETKISPAALLDELKKIASEMNIADLVRVLDEEKLLTLFSPALTGAKINTAGLQKLQKAKQLASVGIDLQVDQLSLFLNILTEKLSPAERTAMADHLGMEKETIDAWHKLDARAKKLEKDLKSPKLQKPSHLYNLLSKAAGELILYLLVRSGERLVQDRIKNYLQKYLPAAQEITDREVLATGVQPGTPKFEKARAELIATRLDARPKKAPPPPEEPIPVVPPPTHAFVRSTK
jgi:tRNA nucleotidyltransferase/poly(A) polymerase